MNNLWFERFFEYFGKPDSLFWIDVDMQKPLCSALVAQIEGDRFVVVAPKPLTDLFFLLVERRGKLKLDSVGKIDVIADRCNRFSPPSYSVRRWFDHARTLPATCLQRHYMQQLLLPVYHTQDKAECSCSITRAIASILIARDVNFILNGVENDKTTV